MPHATGETMIHDQEDEMATAFVRMSGEPSAANQCSLEGGDHPRHEDCVVHAFSGISCPVTKCSTKQRSSGIEYSEFLAWWKLQDERQKGLKFKSTEEQRHVQSSCQ